MWKEVPRTRKKEVLSSHHVESSRPSLTTVSLPSHRMKEEKTEGDKKRTSSWPIKKHWPSHHRDTAMFDHSTSCNTHRHIRNTYIQSAIKRVHRVTTEACTFGALVHQTRRPYTDLTCPFGILEAYTFGRLNLSKNYLANGIRPRLLSAAER